MKTILIIYWYLGGVDFIGSSCVSVSSVCPEMAGQANWCTEESLAVRARNSGRRLLFSSTDLPVMATLFCSGCPVCLALLGSIMDGIAPVGPVLCRLFPMVWINAKGFQGYFQCILKTFSLASMGALSLLQLTIQESFGMRWSAIRAR